jgi:hypothetical protein
MCAGLYKRAAPIAKLRLDSDEATKDLVPAANLSEPAAATLGCIAKPLQSAQETPGRIRRVADPGCHRLHTRWAVTSQNCEDDDLAISRRFPLPGADPRAERPEVNSRGEKIGDAGSHEMFVDDEPVVGRPETLSSNQSRACGTRSASARNRPVASLIESFLGMRSGEPCTTVTIGRHRTGARCHARTGCSCENGPRPECSSKR